MSNVDLPEPNDSEPVPVIWGLPATTWAKMGMLTVLMAGLFWPNLRRLWYKTNPFFGEANWGHSIFVPVIGVYYLILHHEELLKARVKTAWEALGILAGGMLLYAYGIWPGQNDWVKDFGMVVTLFGLVSYLCGWQVMKIAYFPIVFLVCALPWPGLVYSYIASPLQKLAAQVAVFALGLTGVDAFHAGTKINILLPTGQVRSLNVAEACAGLRSLMTFISVGAAVAYLSSRPLWQKLIIIASAVPIAIFCNVMRVSGQGLLDYYVSQELSQSFAHQFVGIIMLIPAFFLILLVGWILDHVIIEEAELKQAAPARVRVAVVLPPTAVAPPPAVSAPRAVAGPAGPRAQPAPPSLPPRSPLAKPGQLPPRPARFVAPPPPPPRRPIPPPSQPDSGTSTPREQQ